MSIYCNGLNARSGATGSSAASNMGLFGGDDPLVDSMRESNIALDILLLQEELSPLERTVRADSAYPSSSVAAAGTGSLLFAPERALRASPLYSGIELFDRRARAYYGEAEGEAVAAPGYEDELDLLHPAAEEAAIGSRTLAVATRVDSTVFAPDNTLFDPYLPLDSEPSKDELFEGEVSAHLAASTVDLPPLGTLDWPLPADEAEQVEDCDQIESKAEESPGSREEAVEARRESRKVHVESTRRPAVEDGAQQAPKDRRWHAESDRTKRWSDKDCELLEQALEEGKCPLEIKETYFKDRTLRAVRCKISSLRAKNNIAQLNHRWTDEDFQLIKCALEEGKSSRTIRNEFFKDCSEMAVADKVQLIKRKYNIKSTNMRWTEADFTLIERKLLDGKTAREIYNEHFANITSYPALSNKACQVRRKLNISSKTHNWTEDEHALIKRELRKGMTVSDIHDEHFFKVVTLAAFREKVRYLTAKRALSVTKYHHWSERDLRLLKQAHDSGMSIPAMHAELFSDLPLRSVREKVKKLGKPAQTALGKRALVGSAIDSKRARHA